MARRSFIQGLGNKICSIERKSPIKVGIDGFSAAGKTTLAKDLADYLISLKKNVILSSIDYFHHPQAHRYIRGPLSPAGYYYHSFNYDALKRLLLDPLSEGGDLIYQKKFFDHVQDAPVKEEKYKAEPDSILIFEGIFLLVETLYPYWDLSLYLEIGYEQYISRGLERHKKATGSIGNLKEKYDKRYYPGQLLYLQENNPKNKSDLLIDFNDFDNPEVLKGIL